MNRFISFMIAVAPFSQAFAAPVTQPTTQPVNVLIAKPALQAQVVRAPQAVQVQAVAGRLRVMNNMKAQREAQRQSLKTVPDGGTFKLDDLVKFSIVDGRLHSEWVGNIPAGQSRRIKIEGSDAVWLVNRFNNGLNGFYNLTRYDFDAPDDAFWMCQFSYQQANDISSIYAQGGDASEINRLSFMQQPNVTSVSLYAMENNQLHVVLNGSAQDLNHLRNDHPDEVCRHLIPLLRKITGQPLLRPGAGDVYRVFTDIPADASVTLKIESFLPALSSIDPIERDQATLGLHNLGAAGALAVLRYDPSFLLPEQLARLNGLVALYSRVLIDDPAAALKDPNFLIDCFEDDDLAVRTRAKDALERLFSHKIAFDPAAPLAKRTAAADALRLRLSQIAAQRREFENFEIP